MTSSIVFNKENFILADKQMYMVFDSRESISHCLSITPGYLKELLVSIVICFSIFASGDVLAMNPNADGSVAASGAKGAESDKPEKVKTGSDKREKAKAKVKEKRENATKAVTCTNSLINAISSFASKEDIESIETIMIKIASGLQKLEEQIKNKKRQYKVCGCCWTVKNRKEQRYSLLELKNALRAKDVGEYPDIRTDRILSEFSQLSDKLNNPSKNIIFVINTFLEGCKDYSNDSSANIKLKMQGIVTGLLKNTVTMEDGNFFKVFQDATIPKRFDSYNAMKQTWEDVYGQQCRPEIQDEIFKVLFIVPKTYNAPKPKNTTCQVKKPDMQLYGIITKDGQEPKEIQDDSMDFDPYVYDLDTNSTRDQRDADPDNYIDVNNAGRTRSLYVLGSRKSLKEFDKGVAGKLMNELGLFVEKTGLALTTKADHYEKNFNQKKNTEDGCLISSDLMEKVRVRNIAVFSQGYDKAHIRIEFGQQGIEFVNAYKYKVDENSGNDGVYLSSETWQGIVDVSIHQPNTPWEIHTCEEKETIFIIDPFTPSSQKEVGKFKIISSTKDNEATDVYIPSVCSINQLINFKKRVGDQTMSEKEKKKAIKENIKDIVKSSRDKCIFITLGLVARGKPKTSATTVEVAVDSHKGENVGTETDVGAKTKTVAGSSKGTNINATKRETENNYINLAIRGDNLDQKKAEIMLLEVYKIYVLPLKGVRFMQDMQMAETFLTELESLEVNSSSNDSSSMDVYD